jgi:hypothetical protein
MSWQLNGERMTMRCLTRDEARIALNVAKLPELLRS